MDYLKVSELCSIKTGKYDANHSKENGKYIFYTCALEPTRTDTFSFEGELVILPGNGANLGEVMYYNGKIEAYQRTYVLYDIKCDPKFLYYFFKGSWKRYILKRQIGSATNYMKLNDISNFKIPQFSNDLQRKIVKILDKSKELIDKRKAQIEALDELVKSRFVEMFGDVNANSKQWGMMELGKVCHKITDGTHKTPNYLSEGIKFISAKDIKSGHVDLENTKFISYDEYKEIQRRCQLEKGDVLLSKSGSIGTPAVLGADEPLGIFESLAVLKLKKEVVNSIFICELLKCDSVQGNMISGTKGISIKHLHLNELRGLKIFVPPIKLQNEFSNFVQQIDKLKFNMEKSLKELENNFNSLMQRAFKGELFN